MHDVDAACVKVGRQVWWFALLLLASFLCFNSAVSAEEGPEISALTIRYPDIHHPYYSQRDKYFQEILKLAMEKSGVKFELLPEGLPSYNEKRSVLFLHNGNYDVHWLHTSREKERLLRPIKVPLYNGAIGWRAFFIRPENQVLFSEVRNVEDLSKLVAAQAQDWPDLKILRANGLRVEVITSWEGMFKLTSIKRIDYFPRSVIEIRRESQLDIAKELVVEKSVIIKYPAAYYFFVRKRGERLAGALEKGLSIALDDGSFDAVFARYFGEDLQALQLDKRQIIEIGNPELESSMPLADRRLWLRASQFSAAD